MWYVIKFRIWKDTLEIYMRTAFLLLIKFCFCNYRIPPSPGPVTTDKVYFLFLMNNYHARTLRQICVQKTSTRIKTV